MQVWCLLQVKPCDPCLGALKGFVYHARRYTSALLYLFTFSHRTLLTYIHVLSIFTVYVQVSVRSQCWISQRPVHALRTIHTLHSTTSTKCSPLSVATSLPSTNKPLLTTRSLQPATKLLNVMMKSVQCRPFSVRHIAVRLVLISLQTQIWCQKGQNFKPTSVHWSSFPSAVAQRRVDERNCMKKLAPTYRSNG